MTNARNLTLSLTRSLTLSLTLSIASLATAQQDGTFPPGGPAGGQDGQRPGGNRGDPAQLVERMMQMDANKDGKISKDEMPAQQVERMFDRADTNKDGFLDKAELEAFAKAGQARGQGGQPGGAGGAQRGGAVNLEGAMKQINGAYKALKASALDAASKSADLDAVQRMQMGLIGAKAGVATLKMSDAARAKFGEDKAGFEAAFRRKMLDSAKLSIELELAILDGKTAEAKVIVGKIHDAEESGHDVFKSDEREGGEAGEAPQNPGRGGRARGGERPAANP
jgi:hypothetical protein